MYISRFNNATRIFILKVCELTDDLVQEIFTEFQSDLEVDDVTSARDCRRWKAKWQILSPKPFKTLESALTPATENSYPNVRRCRLVLLCMPVSTATVEMSFSTMRRVKTYLVAPWERSACPVLPC
ncbi:hypothetical protein DPMN_082130 [Dreissena polymorpha]|uniref:HAT C-terminal dimerisation domain-containing protein n=1 Tax=Dreissena polymorpha TaxID=45954 RepID=A0A9D4BH64_DREPO|nr:hypothetical protein DPMN_082130 [Dreissena polymorpha]